MSGDTHGHGDAPAHGSRRTYLTGFALSVILTAIPFWLVMDGSFGKQATALAIMGFALVQVLVHMIYFLHLDARSEGGWNLMALIFTVVMVAIGLVGSLWVMHHLNMNMMPGMGSGDTSGM
ncbi:cytochrome o ubiquinol oxidase subunit IV [Sphingomonas sp. BIUV-7]|uniref:Cytochrome bo(3) ubiquinol oxidase subunit 4 n=1 Tax=Sphingomonas natans TaxID=3063330 RepID=A0ABT8YB44_9SPHN|nr:cytochrome o ubiquinol oxidase subunit IV [Sphingomonas sp. BIUV-7]MDO6414929.1 cytochrome o ubiquinol oxidase subunit IV [Sphingomonas sp. BIUV-7]